MEPSPQQAREALTSVEVSFSSHPDMLDMTPMEIILGESLLTFGLQTSVRVHNAFQGLPVKPLDPFKRSTINIKLERPILEAYELPTKLDVAQTVFRIQDRKLINNNIEEFIIQACDPTLLTNAETLVTKSWKCTPPSVIVSEMLGSCVGATAQNVEQSCCPRDYVAECIHPFQVISQQGDAALINNDPSFIHFMTYENFGTHHFRSLNSMCRQSPVMEFYYDEVGITSGGGYNNPFLMMSHNFPCDFDLLSDLLNGLGPDGSSMSSIFSFNPFIRSMGIGGTQNQIGCAKGSTVLSIAMTNAGSESEQQGCPDYSQFFALERAAKLGLLEEDKIALNLVVPFNPILNVGKVIRLVLNNKDDKSQLNYGSGDYLIHSLTHNIKFGGYAVTTLDCVSTTVGGGVV